MIFFKKQKTIVIDSNDDIWLLRIQLRVLSRKCSG